MPTNTITTANVNNATLDRSSLSLAPNTLQNAGVRLADLHVTHSPGLLDARVTLPQAPTAPAAIPVRTIPSISVAVQPVQADLDTIWQKIKDATDGAGMLDMFRNGQITPDMLVGEAGQLTMMKLKDVMTQQQAMLDGIRGILDTWNQALKKAADSLGR